MVRLKLPFTLMPRRRIHYDRFQRAAEFICHAASRNAAYQGNTIAIQITP
jgi:hypothetical protein